MSKNLISESEVKTALGITSFRNIPKDKIIEFVSLIPSMDKDVALAIINQFPAYTEYAGTMISSLKETCDTVIEKTDASQKTVLDAYRKILDELGILLKQDNISAERQSEITAQMIDIADKMASVSVEHKEFLAGLVKYKGSIINVALVLGAALLGVGVGLAGKEIPSLTKK